MNARRRWRLFAGTIASALVVVASGCAVDLGTIGGSFSAAADIDDRGDIVGSATTAGTSGSYPTHAWFRPAGGAMTSIDDGAYDSSAAAVDDAGTVVGTVRAAAGSPSQAFLWRATGGLVTLGTLGGPASSAVDINTTGWIIGRSDTAGEYGGGLRHAFLRDPATGRLTELARLPGYDFVEPTAINDDGLIVGTAYNEIEYPVSSQAVVWQAGTHTISELPGLFSTATGVNGHGDIVGHTLDGHAVVWARGTHTVTSIPALAGTTALVATAINDAGAVVGHLQLGSATKAFIWTAAGGTRSLGGLGGTDAYVSAVNDAGVAVGSSELPDDPWAHATRYDPD